MSAEKMPEWKKQEELRAQRRGRRKAPRTFEPQPKDYSIGKLRLVPKRNDAAFDDLLVASTLRTYFPDCCKTDGARRRTVLAGELLLEAPRVILNQIERELRTGWHRGKLQP